MRLTLVIIGCGAFVLLGIIDAASGSPWPGVAEMLVALANGIFFTR